MLERNSSMKSNNFEVLRRDSWGTKHNTYTVIQSIQPMNYVAGIYFFTPTLQTTHMKKQMHKQF